MVGYALIEFDFNESKLRKWWISYIKLLRIEDLSYCLKKVIEFITARDEETGCIDVKLKHRLIDDTYSLSSEI